MSTTMDSPRCACGGRGGPLWQHHTPTHCAAYPPGPLCDVCGSPTHREELLLPGESGGRVAHQLCYWRQRALAGERKGP